MKKLTKEDISYLIKSGFLMPRSQTPFINNKCSQKPLRFKMMSSAPAGYPLLGREYAFYDFFPCVEYTNGTKRYVEPECLHEILYDKTTGIYDYRPFIEEMKKWALLAQEYLVQNLDENVISQVEIDLLNTFRNAYAIYITKKFDCFDILSKEFLNLYERGQYYRNLLYEEINEVYQSLPPKNIVLKNIANNIFDNEDDFILFEHDIINNWHSTKWGNIFEMNEIAVGVWRDFVYSYYDSNYKKDSPILQKIRQSLYSDIVHPPKSVIAILSWLELYDIFLVKEDLLYCFNNNSHREVTTYVEQRLKHYNLLPNNSALLLTQEIQTVSKNTIVLDINYLRNQIGNNLFGAETLLAIIEKAFKEDEKDYTYVNHDIFFNEGIVRIYIESLTTETTQKLSHNYVLYLEAILHPNFLTSDVIEKLTYHGNDTKRTLYENDATVIESYKRVKNSILLNTQLKEDLPITNTRSKLNKV